MKQIKETLMKTLEDGFGNGCIVFQTLSDGHVIMTWFKSDRNGEKPVFVDLMTEYDMRCMKNILDRMFE